MMHTPAHKNLEYPPGQIINRPPEQHSEKPLIKEIEDYQQKENEPCAE